MIDGHIHLSSGLPFMHDCLHAHAVLLTARNRTSAAVLRALALLISGGSGAQALPATSPTENLQKFSQVDATPLLCCCAFAQCDLRGMLQVESQSHRKPSEVLSG